MKRIAAIAQNIWLPPISDLMALSALGLVVRIASALPMRVPGYMDAYYYFVGASRIVQGYGLTEPYIWNYLPETLGLPMPAFQFWLPLTSLVMVPLMAVFGVGYRAGQYPMILLSALLPAVAYLVSHQIAPNPRRAWIAGLLMIFPPFYAKYWVATDTFAPYALLGSLALLAGYRALRSRSLAWFATAGALVGLSHLARADAPLLLVTIAIVSLHRTEGEAHRPSRALPTLVGILIVGLIYLLTLLPWMWHTWRTSGVLFNSSGLPTVFLRSYDDLYTYGPPASLQSYLAWGWPNIVRSKIEAAGSNLLTVVGVFMAFFLAPFAAIEMWARRRERLVRLTGWYLLLLYGVMTLVFTFPGPRGSLFHSGAALLPFLLPLAVHGLDRSVSWVARWRATWDGPQATRVFGVGTVMLSILFSGILYVQGVSDWNRQDELYPIVGQWLDERAVPKDEPVLVGNPPAFYYFTGRSGLAVPSGGPEVVLELCERFGASYLLLDANHPQPLDDLYSEVTTSPAISLIQTWHDARLEGKLYRCVPW